MSHFKETWLFGNWKHASPQWLCSILSLFLSCLYPTQHLAKRYKPIRCSKILNDRRTPQWQQICNHPHSKKTGSVRIFLSLSVYVCVRMCACFSTRGLEKPIFHVTGAEDQVLSMTKWCEVRVRYPICYKVAKLYLDEKERLRQGSGIMPSDLAG